MVQGQNKYQMKPDLAIEPVLVMNMMNMMTTVKTMVMLRKRKKIVTMKMDDDDLVDEKYLWCTLSPNSAINKL